MIVLMAAVTICAKLLFSFDEVKLFHGQTIKIVFCSGKPNWATQDKDSFVSADGIIQDYDRAGFKFMIYVT